MSAQSARNHAERLVDELHISLPPVQVRTVAEFLGLAVMMEPLDEGMSGLLITPPTGKACVVINSLDPLNRQRFTIGHEIGHYYMRHQFEAGSHVHADRGHFISYRGPRASAGIDPREIEANNFASTLLMPSKMLRRSVAEMTGGKPLLDEHVTELAVEYLVSEQAMTIRLTGLGLL